MVQNRLEAIPGNTKFIAKGFSIIYERNSGIYLHFQSSYIIRQLKFVGLPLAVLGNGTHVLVCTYDYVTNTRQVVDAVDEYRGQIMANRR